jgi:ribosome-binding factor A
MANQRRVFKLGERIQGVIASELQRSADPRFTMVTITSAVVSVDMRIAKVYWMSSADPERRQEIEAAFEGAQGHFRRALGKEISIRHIPKLKFFYDDTLEVAAQVDELFARIKKTGDDHEDEPINS